MKKILFLSLVLFLPLANSYPQQENQKKPIELTIESENNLYEVGDTITLTVVFKNNSEKDVILFWSTGIPSVEKTENENGGSATIRTSASLLPEVKQIYIKPGQSATKTIHIPTLGWKPLAYKVKVEHTSPNLDLKRKAESYQDYFGGTLTSNAISVKVENTNPFKY